MEHERFIDSEGQQGPVVDERHGTKRFSCSARGTLCQLGILRQRCRRVEAPNAKSSANPRGHTHILTQYYNYYYPKPKYLIIGYMDP